MKQTERPLWKKSVLQNLTHSDICQYLYEISENGDMYGYDAGETGCELEYKPLFDELSAGANTLLEALTACMPPDCWDDMTVALLGHQQTVLGYIRTILPCWIPARKILLSGKPKKGCCG